MFAIMNIMNKINYVFLIVLLTCSSVSAQTVEEIVEQYLENIGGEQAWKNIHSKVIVGKMSMQGMDLPMTNYTKAPNLQYTEINVMGKKVVQAFDGTYSWSINPFLGGTSPQRGTEEESREVANTVFENEFIDYQDKGIDLTLLGTEEVEGTECFKVSMRKKEGSEVIYFFDAENFIPILTKSEIKEGPMKGNFSEAYYSDYQEVEGVFIAFLIEIKLDGQSFQKMTFESVKINPDLDDAKFKMPAN